VIVRALLEIGAKVDEEDRWDARTALHMAAPNGHEAVVRLLVESGAVVDGSRNDDIGTPLIDAATIGHEAVVRLLLSKEANADITDLDGNPALHLTALGGHESVVRLLLDHGADPQQGADLDGRRDGLQLRKGIRSWHSCYWREGRRPRWTGYANR
jgi:ankyrin repeat protein